MNKVLTGMQNYQECPIWEDTNEIHKIGKEMYQSIRRLRRNITRCESCDHLETCGFRNQFNQIVNQVVNEVLESWALGTDAGEKAG
jgi:hypothetical protein